MFTIVSLSGYLAALLCLRALGFNGPNLPRWVTHGVAALGKLLTSGGTALATGSIAGLLATFSGELGWLTPGLALSGAAYGTLLCFVGGVFEGQAGDEIESRTPTSSVNAIE